MIRSVLLSSGRNSSDVSQKVLLITYRKVACEVGCRNLPPFVGLFNGFRNLTDSKLVHFLIDRHTR